MLLLLLLTIGAVTLAFIRTTISGERERELTRVEKITTLLKGARFPLTATVLQDMQALAGAEFVVTNRRNQIMVKTSAAPTEIPTKLSLRPAPINRVTAPESPPSTSEIELTNSAGKAYYYAVVGVVGQPDQPGQMNLLHVFLPRPSELALWWRASRAPLLIAAIVLPLACLIGLAFANQLARPLKLLRAQVHRISGGELQPVPPPTRDDEIRDLHLSVNEMAQQLQDHERQLRQNERLRTLVQFSNGVAHHLRNAATGCKLAVELLACEEDSVSKSENYQVAIRQLGLMDNYIRRYLSLANSTESGQLEAGELMRQPVDLAATLEHVVYLLRPTAEHLRVDLKAKAVPDLEPYSMSNEDAEQLMLNLISNAIAAASGEGYSAAQRSSVNAELLREGNRVVFRVIDSGRGPRKDIADQIFQPFVTGSREGTGLGLALVQQIAERVGGEVTWQRLAGTTCFSFQFGPATPATPPNSSTQQVPIDHRPLASDPTSHKPPRNESTS